MLLTFVRTIILYILVLIVMRFMGKREIGQLQPFELAISIMIADLATLPMAEPGIPITNGVIPIVGLLVMHLIISIINMKSMKIHTKGVYMIKEEGKYFFGVCKVSERGQIVIPKEARDVFGIKAGDSLLLLGDVEKGMALVKTEVFSNVAEDILSGK